MRTMERGIRVGQAWKSVVQFVTKLGPSKATV